ncbi:MULTISPECIES: glycosyltransferase [Yersiniaceae]|uniref:Glycosyltransferase n=1 Tax=Nissabacter archeti TaxID=1917880 RepID=A0ABS5JME9_9GAMM|nr:MULTISPECIES: glycosyltransferase [Yersiniaceae]MBS0971165.1 glycosyltransferase [Nissabacter archeti]MDV5141876.1 glycosyltransferase [Chimaeribacter arupi]PLR44322.1 glycosyl transferase [Chimaeribacter arupi]
MRIVMMIDGLGGGGAEKVVLTLCEGMQKMGHQITLLSLQDVCAYPIPAGIHYQVIADTSRAPWRKMTELPRRAAALDKVLRQLENAHGRFDLAISNLHKTDRIVRRSRVLGSDRLWFCVHGVLSRTYLGHRTGLDRWLKKRKMAQVYQHQNMISVSQAVAEDLVTGLGVKPNASEVINNPFDIDAIRQLAAQPCEWAGKPYLIHVGRFHEQKRHDRLLNAYALSGITAPLLLAGTGSDARTAAIKNLANQLGIADRVIFMGFQANPFPLIKHASLLVLSSDNEGFGNVLVEALICGTPVVSTDCPGGPHEILESTGMGRGLSALTAESLAEKIREGFTQPLPIREAALQKYSIQAICRRYLALYRN